jgi:hypothetical protein
MHQDYLLRAEVCFSIALALSLVGQSSIAADDASTSGDKSQYNLFHVAPSDRLRPLSLDQQDGVTDPTTVDAGYVQLQGNLVDYFSYGKDYGPEHFSVDHFSWSPRISIGVMNNVDVFLHPFFHVTDATYSGPYYNASRETSGFEMINLGAKVNLWGNDDGQTALAVAPYVTIPNGGPVLGGGDISLAMRLPNQFYLKLMTGPYAYSVGDNAHFGIEDSLSLHKTLMPKADAYAYLNTIWQSSASDWIGYAGLGLGYQVCPNLEVFFGIGFGLTSNSYDYNPRLGLGWRF